ncbi:MAG: A/G-specific adenine glycosylase [Pseudomonadales bacterium]|nr:A/G-specific adenine glycosylase [Pseudomonadales bacterium]MCP5344710.1 A/G-specific adenine glycosylase [Pseudomonadales bacterium]
MPAPDFATRVLQWFAHSGRHHLPWQESPSPYRVWVSEIMLQQTQVATVIPYFQRFMAHYPAVEDLATAQLDEVLHLWTGLGYYARARNLHRCAQIVQADHQGVFPRTVEDLSALPGIGRSTAGAILSLACGVRAPILDGNVKRVLCRHQAIEGWPDAPKTLKPLWALAETLTPAQAFAPYTQAMMDLGATVCTRSKPDCARCPLNQDCQACQQGRQSEFPQRKPARSKPQRSTYMLMGCNRQGEVLLEQRPATGIWGGLWSFREFDSLEALEGYCQQALGVAKPELQAWPQVKHSFSHFDLSITPVEVTVDTPLRAVMEPAGALWYPLQAKPGTSGKAVGLAAPVKTLLTQLAMRPAI